LTNKPTIDLKEVRKKLKKLGFVKKRGRRHEIWDNGSGHIIPLSHGNQDVGKTLLTMICHELGITKKKFLDI